MLLAFPEEWQVRQYAHLRIMLAIKRHIKVLIAAYRFEKSTPVVLVVIIGTIAFRVTKEDFYEGFLVVNEISCSFFAFLLVRISDSISNTPPFFKARLHFHIIESI